MINDEDIKYFASVHAGGPIGEIATELLQLRAHLAEAEADRLAAMLGPQKPRNPAKIEFGR